MERCWLRHFGVPKYLRVDSAKGWESRTVRDWCSDKGIILEVAPAESHNWLSGTSTSGGEEVVGALHG